MSADTDHIDDIAAELALGLVSGPERGVALTHLLECAHCRAHVEELADAVDALLLLAPGAEPPEGFESRVLDHVAPVATGRRWRARWRSVLAVAAVAALLLGIAALVGRSANPPLDIASGEMMTPDGVDVGEAFVYQGDPSWVFVAVPGWTGHPEGIPEYFLSVTFDDGTKSVLGHAVLDPGRGAWGIAVDLDVANIDRVELVDGAGTAWCSASI